MQAFQQLCGFNTLMYYSATLFKEIGFDQPTAVGLIVSGTNFIFTLIALKYIDIVGRRKIMIISAPGMIFGLTLASIAFHCKQRLRIPWCLLRLHYSLQSLLKKPAVTWWMAPNIRPLGLLSSSYPWSYSLLPMLADLVMFLGSKSISFSLQCAISNLLYQTRRVIWIGSPRDRHVTRNSNKLGCQSIDRVNISVSDGLNYTLWSLWVLCRAMSARLVVLPFLFPRNSWFKSWGSSISFQGWIRYRC